MSNFLFIAFSLVNFSGYLAFNFSIFVIAVFSIFHPKNIITDFIKANNFESLCFKRSISKFFL